MLIFSNDEDPKKIYEIREILGMRGVEREEWKLNY